MGRVWLEAFLDMAEKLSSFHLSFRIGNIDMLLDKDHLVY